MLSRKQRYWTEAILILIWIASINFHSAVSILSIKSFTLMTGVGSALVGNKLAEYWVSPTQFFESTLFGFFFGVAFVWVDRVFRNPKYSRTSFGRLILLKTLLYLLGLVIAFLLIYGILNFMGIYSQDITTDLKLWAPVVLLVALIFGGIVAQILFMNFLIQTIENAGLYNIVRFLTGKYRTPVEEQRVFMFLDLKDSTGIAEELGNQKYSQLIRDCFNDLNLTVDEYNAEIYQYVGDEVVLTWENLTQKNNLDCIRFFYSFKALLESKKQVYISKFGIVPEFKAGCHEGVVTTTEIGFIKREIAFHGDVINTASRIQKLNRDLGSELLVSGKMEMALRNQKEYQFLAHGAFQLRGKHQNNEIFEVIKLNTQLN